MHCFGGFDAAFATECGQRLTFDCGLDVEVNVEYEFTRLTQRSSSWGDRSDAIRLQLWVPDSEGCVWTAVAHISSEHLHDLLQLASTCDCKPTPFVDLAPTSQHAFREQTLVTGVEFYTDDRIWRSFSFRERTYDLHYNCRSVWFDIARPSRYENREQEKFRRQQVSEYGSAYDDQFCKNRSLVVRAIFAIDQSDDEIVNRLRHDDWERWEPIPSLTFQPGRVHDCGLLELLRGNDAFLDKKFGTWERGPFVRPLVFSRTEETATPQTTCNVV